jgi:hypothetical protein
VGCPRSVSAAHVLHKCMWPVACSSEVCKTSGMSVISLLSQSPELTSTVGAPHLLFMVSYPSRSPGLRLILRPTKRHWRARGRHSVCSEPLVTCAPTSHQGGVCQHGMGLHALRPTTGGQGRAAVPICRAVPQDGCIIAHAGTCALLHHTFYDEQQYVDGPFSGGSGQQKSSPLY